MPLGAPANILATLGEPAVHRPVLRRALLTFDGALEAIDAIGRPSVVLGLRAEIDSRLGLRRKS